jgi:hypothetical protein
MAMAKKTAKTKKTNRKPAHAIAMHAENGDHHVVGLGNIRVIIVPDESDFFAQGLEIDYAAQGKTVDQVKKHFEIGLKATIKQHLKIYGTISNLLKPAPPDVWQELLPEKLALHNRYWHISTHTIDNALPYEGINYLVSAAAQAAAHE